jgi:DNA-binding NarL/FixJ family response regulator
MGNPRLQVLVGHRELDSMARRLGAFIAVSQASRGELMVHALVLTAMSDAELRHLWEPYRFGRRDIDPMLPALVGDEGGIVARLRQDVVPDRVWYRSRLVREYFDPLRIDHCVQSEVRLPGGLLHRLAFARAAGDRPLGDAEREGVQGFHRSIVQGWDRDPSLRLSPKTREVLEALLAGMSAKEAGDRLGLGRSSIDRRVDAIYRCFGVRSRAELLAAVGHEGQPARARLLLDELSPRQRQALALLLTELSERDIACVMGATFNTVHGYVKTVYRALDVRSRPELMARYSGLRWSGGVRDSGESSQGE